MTAIRTTGVTRVQMTRQRPWRAAHPDAIRVDRSTRWGNPFTVAEYGTRAVAVAQYRRVLLADALPGIGRFAPVTLAEAQSELAGHELACWCPLDDACHADVLLEIAADMSESGR